MNLNEICIGDTIYINEHVVRVVALNITGFIIGRELPYSNSSNYYEDHISKLKPVPLTKTILSKMGWIEEIGSFEIQKLKVKDNLVLEWWPINGEFDINNEPFPKSILYVHEFQQLIRQMGLDKCIDGLEEVVLGTLIPKKL